MKTSNHPNASERGQSLMELAISLVVLLMLLMGSVEFGLALFQYVTIRDAAQEGAVYGSINPTDIDGIKWRTLDAASDVVRLNPNEVRVFVNGTESTMASPAANSCEGETGGDPNTLEVVAAFDHPVTFPFVADMINGGNIRLEGSATTTILQPTCP